MTDTLERLDPAPPIRLRASAMPRIMACPGSVHLEQYGSVNDAATLGTAVHECCARIVEGKEPLALTKATVYASDPDEVQKLAGAASFMWGEFGRHFPNAKTEVTMPPLHLPLLSGKSRFFIDGHADIVSSPGDGTIRIGDWKSGWRQGDYDDQLKTYGLLALADADQFERSDIERVYVAIFWLREKSLEGRWYDREELEGWKSRITDTMQDSQGRLQTGSQCAYCPVSRCPALMGQSLALLSNDIVEITAENVAEAHYFRQAAEAKLKALASSIKQFLSVHPAVPLGDGKELRLVNQVQQSVVMSAPVWQAMVDEIGDEAEALRLVKVPKGALLDKVKEKYSRGEKGKAAEAFIDTLDSLGGIGETVSQRVEIKKVEAA